MPIDHDASSGDGLIKAPVLRLKDQGDGLVGVIFSANERTATDWATGKDKLWDDGNPVKEYVLNIAAKAGKGYFTQRDADGNAVKDASGRNALAHETFNERDVCVTTNWSLLKACKEARVNEGHEVRIERLSPAGASRVDWKVEVLSTDNPLRRFDPDAPAPSGLDHGADQQAELAESPF